MDASELTGIGKKIAPRLAMQIFAVFLVASTISYGAVVVTSQEQFARQKTDAWPEKLTYNFERAYLEVRANENCPAHSKAFFSIHIGREGEVKAVRGRLLTLSRGMKSVGLKWADTLLKQMHFRPLLYGTGTSTVDTAVTLVCVE
jgi:hypothetical protein